MNTIDDIHVAKYLSRYAQKRRTLLIAKFISKSSRVLDLGCGNGAYIPFLKAKAEMVVGLDVFPELCRVAKSRGKNFEIICGHAMALPFKNEAFDATWASEIIEHLPTWEILDEIERVSKRTIVITIPNPIFPDYESPDHFLRYTWGTLRHVLRLRKIGGWKYAIRGIGFHNVTAPAWLRQLTTGLTWFFPVISPSIAILGEQKVEK